MSRRDNTQFKTRVTPEDGDGGPYILKWAFYVFPRQIAFRGIDTIALGGSATSNASTTYSSSVY